MALERAVGLREKRRAVVHHSEGHQGIVKAVTKTRRRA